MAASANTNMIGGWDWANKHVQPRDKVSESRFVSGATVLISAGPPRLSGATGDQGLQSVNQADINVGSENLVFPIGVCLDANIQQQRQLQRVYEIGSERCYFIQGRSSGGVVLNRVLFNGANINRVLYAYYPTAKIPSLTDAVQTHTYDEGTIEGQNLDDLYMDQVANTVATEGGKSLTYTGEKKLPDIVMNPGYNNMYINMASDLFHHPIGLMFTFQDHHKHTFANFYCEMCFVVSHGMQINSQNGSMVAEQVNIQFDRIASIKVV